MTQLIREADENTEVSKSKLYLALGKALVDIAPPEAQRLPILNEVWKVRSAQPELSSQGAERDCMVCAGGDQDPESGRVHGDCRGLCPVPAHQLQGELATQTSVVSSHCMMC